MNPLSAYSSFAEVMTGKDKAVVYVVIQGRNIPKNFINKKTNTILHIDL